MTQMLFPDIRALSRAEAISTIYSRLLATSIVNSLNAALLVAVVTDRGKANGAIEWLILMVLLSLARSLLYFRYRADPERQNHTRRWTALAVAGSFGAGLLWGLGPVLPFSDFATHLWFWAFVIGGMTAGATSLHAAHLPTALAFTIPASLPLAISLLMQGTLQGYAAAAMTLAFIATMTFTAILFSREFARAQELSFAMEARAGELDDINRRLLREMEDHRSTSEALHQSQKMDALGNLTGGLAHDFNNMLTVVINGLDMIVASSREEKVRDLALSAVGAAESGADLLARLLAFARKRRMEPKPVDIAGAITNFRDLLQHAVSSSVRMDFDFGSQVCVASVDMPQFQAMLLNLVVNARDAMPQGGLIAIAVSRLHLDMDALKGSEVLPGDFIAIAVRDTGSGMAPDALERAFEPFFTTKAHRGGTGLGLSQVYGFARQSGGFGRIESAPGEGTCVTIFLPAEDPALAVAGDAPPSTDAARTYALLLVDDNRAVLRAVADGLILDGWDVVCAHDPREALALVEQRPFDIVVTDMDMPGDINGQQFALEIRRLHPAIPVLLMSGADPVAGEGLADMPFIAKPFRKQALVETMRSLIA